MNLKLLSNKKGGAEWEMVLAVLVLLIIFGISVAIANKTFTSQKSTLDAGTTCKGLGGECKETCGIDNPQVTGVIKSQLGCDTGQTCCKVSTKDTVIVSYRTQDANKFIPMNAGDAKYNAVTIAAGKKIFFDFYVQDQENANFCVIGFIKKAETHINRLTYAPDADQWLCPQGPDEQAYYSLNEAPDPSNSKAAYIVYDNSPIQIVVTIYSSAPAGGNTDDMNYKARYIANMSISKP